MKHNTFFVLPFLAAAVMVAAILAAPPAQVPAAGPRVEVYDLEPVVDPTEFLPTLAPSSTLALAPTATPALQHAVQTATPAPRLSARDWQNWPVLPVVSPKMREVYQRGLALGNDPHAFSKVGDCQNVSSFFLSIFENPDDHRLGGYAALQETIDYFDGSFSRESLAVRGGFNVASVLSPFWADPDECNRGENPLQCEFRHQRPSIVFISMETWWSGKPAAEYEGYLREIVAYALERGVVPILGTKADNWEGDHGINQAIARVAADYEVPLWNFWRAVQPLPNHGLSSDGFHLTFARNFFDDPVRMQSAWPVRNLTALQALDMVWRDVK
jgi:hypothetical protein